MSDEAPKKVDLLVRLPADLHAQVKEHAERNERSIAGTVRLALKQYLRFNR